MTKGREESDGRVVPESRRKAVSTSQHGRGGKAATASQEPRQLGLYLETADSPRGDALVRAYAEHTGLTREGAVNDLLRRGFTHVELREMRNDVADMRAAVLDLAAGQDALAPYTIALLSILAHWSAKSGGARLTEEEYQALALDTARLIWDSLLAGRGIPVPARPLAKATQART